MIVVPVAMLLIFLLLYSTFHSIRLACSIYLAVPMAATGGVSASVWRGCRSRSRRAVGFIALFRRGRAQRPGLGQRRRALRKEGVEPHEAAQRRPWSGSGRS